MPPIPNLDAFFLRVTLQEVCESFWRSVAETDASLSFPVSVCNCMYVDMHIYRTMTASLLFPV
jgi:hypothetical protein